MSDDDEAEDTTRPPEAGIVGRTYLEHGRSVVILTQWGTRANGYTGPAGGPRNVRIRRADSTTTIRPSVACVGTPPTNPTSSGEPDD